MISDRHSRGSPQKLLVKKANALWCLHFTEKNLDSRRQMFPLGHGEGGSQREKRVPSSLAEEMLLTQKCLDREKNRTKTESSKFMFRSLIKRETKQNSCLWATLPWSHRVSVWPPILSAPRLPDESRPGYLANVTNPFLYCMEYFSEQPDPSSDPQLLRPGKPRFLVYEDTKTGLQNPPPKHFAYLK